MRSGVARDRAEDAIGDVLREFMGRTGAFRAVPVDTRLGKLRLTRSGSGCCLGADRLRTKWGRCRGASAGSSRSGKGDALAKRETGLSEWRGLNCPSVRSYQTLAGSKTRRLGLMHPGCNTCKDHFRVLFTHISYQALSGTVGLLHNLCFSQYAARMQCTYKSI